jgi:hypothetical protein
VPPVHLTVTWPGGATQDLGDASPAGDMGFSVVVRVPVATPPGMARVRDDGGWSTPYRFQVEQSTARMHSSPPAGADGDE